MGIAFLLIVGSLALIGYDVSRRARMRGQASDLSGAGVAEEPDATDRPELVAGSGYTEGQGRRPELQPGPRGRSRLRKRCET